MKILVLQPDFVLAIAGLQVFPNSSLLWFSNRTERSWFKLLRTIIFLRIDQNQILL